MNKRLLTVFAAEMRNRSIEELRVIAADASYTEYSEEYVSAARHELARRGHSSPAPGGTELTPSTSQVLPYSTADHETKPSQQLGWWLAFAVIAITIGLVILTILHASYVRRKLGY